ncbi:ABC transporter permease subunit [Heliobacterium undosum]|uniref:ABC transporter permease subunit n=1 Tax=Heliomicrobium undosum TaxID=121734 RepID=A0A845L2C8_9FIRM|nr:ABC transporter permease [Heliomicrobium undosum]MZP30707.1 ABC transporter permease subunit [Heliomicrobium undosum]
MQLINLIRNENMKLLHQRSTQALFACSVLLILGLGLLQRYNSEITPEFYRNLWGFVLSATSASGWISLVGIVLAAGSVANEFSSGTIKQLLIRPVSRAKILFSKFCSIVMITLRIIAAMFITSVLAGGLFYGFDSIASPSIPGLIEKDLLWQLLIRYGAVLVNGIVMIALALMLSVLFRNAMMAAAFGILLSMLGTTTLTLVRDFSWAKYLLFAHSDLTPYINGHPLLPGMTLSFSLAMIALYLLLFGLITSLHFAKRDI